MRNLINHSAFRFMLAIFVLGAVAWGCSDSTPSFEDQIKEKDVIFMPTDTSGIYASWSRKTQGYVLLNYKGHENMFWSMGDTSKYPMGV